MPNERRWSMLHRYKSQKSTSYCYQTVGNACWMVLIWYGTCYKWILYNVHKLFRLLGWISGTTQEHHSNQDDTIMMRWWRETSCFNKMQCLMLFLCLSLEADLRNLIDREAPKSLKTISGCTGKHWKGRLMNLTCFVWNRRCGDTGRLERMTRKP